MRIKEGENEENIAELLLIHFTLAVLEYKYFLVLLNHCSSSFLLVWHNTTSFNFIIAGFYCSPDEPTALIQAEGGPCAVIAPVQAFILKQLLSESDISTWNSISSDKCYQFLVQASTEILKQAAGEKIPKFSIVYMDSKFSDEENEEKKRWSKKMSKIENEEEGGSVRDEENENKSEEVLLVGTNEDNMGIDIDHFHSQLR